MTGISNTASGQLVAAQLSQAAYVPLSQYQNGTNPALPSGWSVDTFHSGNTTNNQFITFVNDTTQQVVMAFKGTNNLSNGVSDIANSGATQYTDIQPLASTMLNGNTLQNITGILSTYSGYQVVTDGHSLGGGLAQTFAVENNLSGFGQNSLPIAQGSIDAINQTGNFSSLLSTWQSSGNTFGEVNVAGDPATAYYSGQTYLNSSPTVLASPYTIGEVAGLTLAATGNPATAAAGSAVAAYDAYEVHSIGSLVNLEQQNLAGGTSAPAITISATDQSSLLSASENNAPTLNVDGSLTMTGSDGSTFNITAGTNASNAAAYTISGSGSTTQAPVSISVSANQVTDNFADNKSLVEQVAPASGVDSVITYYSSINGGGSQDSIDYNWSNGTSEVIISPTTDTGLPSTYNQVIDTYSSHTEQNNSTLTQQVIYFNNDTSQVQEIDPYTGVLQEIKSFNDWAGPGNGETPAQALIENSNGTSQVQIYNDGGTGNNVFENFSSQNGTGNPTSVLTNLANNAGSVVESYQDLPNGNPLPSGASEVISYYNQANNDGTLTQQNTINNNDTYQVEQFNPNGNVLDTTQTYSGSYGSGTLAFVNTDWSSAVGGGSQLQTNAGFIAGNIGAPVNSAEEITNFSGIEDAGKVNTIFNIDPNNIVNGIGSEEDFFTDLPTGHDLAVRNLLKAAVIAGMWVKEEESYAA